MNRTDKVNEGQVQICDIQNYRPSDNPMVGTTAKKVMAFRPLSKASILTCLQILEEADRQHADDRFWLFYGP